MRATIPPELQLEGATINTSYGTGGQVLAVTGPYPPDPDWHIRPWMGGYTMRTRAASRKATMKAGRHSHVDAI